MVAAGFGGGIRTAWRIWRGFGEEIVCSMQIAIHFIGGDMVEAERRFSVRVKRGPVSASGFQQGVSTNDIRFNKRRRAVDGTVYMAFRRQVHHAIGLILLENSLQ